jgi:hypothetical protein
MPISTGLPALDKVLHGVQPGDNIVWRVDNIEEYIAFVKPFCENALSKRKKLVYFRYGCHKPLVKEGPGIEIHSLHPEAGFEPFITQITDKIKSEGKGRHYVFDSLSDMPFDCFSDRMIGNFFMLTCPFLYELETVAYFSIFRHYHSYHASSPIAETTQLLLDVYRNEGKIYVQPTKVKDRYSPTMYMLHLWENDDFIPIMESAGISDVLTTAPWPGLKSASYRLVGVWDKRFMHAEEILSSYKNNEIPIERVNEVFHRLISLVISRDERIGKLAEKYLTLSDLIYIWKRMIGSGMIGGKSIGMLLSRAILKKMNRRWADLLEAHDSFFIASDVFYTFLVENECWWERQKQKHPTTFLDGLDKIRDKILKGKFPDYIVRRFADMLDYFGQSPIIVRSSSLLEDNFGNAFAGKYESVFCANQGTHKERLENLMAAIRNIYASTMSKEALNYRKKRGVLDKDEQMALLVQRVSGAPYDKFFFPQLAGVAFSFNPYVWTKEIEPEAGVMRLVFGLGTRAVDRHDDDYTRIVALNAPEKRPEANFDEVKRHTQRKVDLLDLEKDTFANADFLDILKQYSDLPVDLFAVRDRALERRMRERKGHKALPWVLTFNKLFSMTDFVKDIKEILKTLKYAYSSHVDIEFTTNFFENNTYKINLLQCRPLQVKEINTRTAPLPSIKQENLILEAHGAVIGHSRRITIDRLVYVVPSVYGALSENKRFDIARLIGRLNHMEEDNKDKNIMLVGPGRWGTSTPALGIPVSFAEINTASVLCEIDSMHEGLIPDLSLGTHFFNEMVEMNILYIAYFTGKKVNHINMDFLMKTKNRLTELLPKAAEWKDVVHVIDGTADRGRKKLYLYADSIKQKGLVYIDN